MAGCTDAHEVVHQQATRVEKHKDNDVDDDEERACSICLEAAEGDVVTLPCRHAFHRSCINEWLRASENVLHCPLCRAVFPGELLTKLEWGDFALVPVLAVLWLSRMAVRLAIRQVLSLCRSIRHPLQTASSITRRLRACLRAAGRSLFAVGMFMATNVVVRTACRIVAGAFQCVCNAMRPPVTALAIAAGRALHGLLNVASSAMSFTAVVLSDVLCSVAWRIAMIPEAGARLSLAVGRVVGTALLEMITDGWNLAARCSRAAYVAGTTCAETLSNQWTVRFLTSALEYILENAGFVIDGLVSVWTAIFGALAREVAMLFRVSATASGYVMTTLLDMACSSVKQLWRLLTAIARPAASGVHWLWQRTTAAVCTAVRVGYMLTARCFEAMLALTRTTGGAFSRCLWQTLDLLASASRAVVAGSHTLGARVVSLLTPVFHTLQSFFRFLQSTSALILDSGEAFLARIALGVVRCIVHCFSFACNAFFAVGHAVNRYVVSPVVYALLHIVVGTYRAGNWVRKVSTDRLWKVSLWTYYYVALPLWNAGLRLLRSAGTGCLALWRRTSSIAGHTWNALAVSWARSSAFCVSVWYAFIVPSYMRVWEGATAAHAVIAPVAQKSLARVGGAFLAMQARFFLLYGSISRSTTAAYGRVASVSDALWTRATANWQHVYDRLLTTYSSVSARVQHRYAALYLRMAALQARIWQLMERF